MDPHTVAGARVNVLFVSNLFPNSLEPARGVFNLHQMRSLATLCEVRIVAPVSWFFLRGRLSAPAEVPAEERLGGFQVAHPKAFYLPKVGTLNPWLYALSVHGLIRRIRRDFPFQVILVNWAYPDACGIAKVARWVGVPFVASISGSDANRYLAFRIRRRQILRMLADASAVTVRSRALKELLVSHGLAGQRIHVLYNGVDKTDFTPLARDDARQRLGLGSDEQVLLYVGRLSPEKGVADLLDALAYLRDHHGTTPRLVVVGDGIERQALHRQAERLGLGTTTIWTGWKKPTEIASFMAAADALCLPSHSEGVPNAALEAFGCGIPVVGTRVGGLPEIVTEATGVLAEPRAPVSFGAALHSALGRSWDAHVIRAHAARFDWSDNARRLHQVLKDALDT